MQAYYVCKVEYLRTIIVETINYYWLNYTYFLGTCIFLILYVRLKRLFVRQTILIKKYGLHGLIFESKTNTNKNNVSASAWISASASSVTSGFTEPMCNIQICEYV